MIEMTDNELIAELVETERILRQIAREQEETQNGAKYDWLQEGGEQYQSWLEQLEYEARRRGYRYDFERDEWTKDPLLSHRNGLKP